MVDCTAEMLDNFEQTLRKRIGPNEIEVSERLSRLAADIIARTEFGSSYEKGKRIFEQLNSLQQLSSQSGRYIWLSGSRLVSLDFALYCYVESILYCRELILICNPLLFSIISNIMAKQLLRIGSCFAC